MVWRGFEQTEVAFFADLSGRWATKVKARRSRSRLAGSTPAQREEEARTEEETTGEPGERRGAQRARQRR
jgi:hypothetical protein